MIMFGFEMNKQTQPFGDSPSQNNFYQQPRQGNNNVGFMEFSTPENKNNNMGNGFVQEQQYQQQQMQFNNNNNNNNNNYTQFAFDNQQNQMQFNNNTTNTNYPQLDNQPPSNYTLNLNNQTYIQQNQHQQPQTQTMLNTNQFLSQPLPERNQTGNNTIQAFDPSPSYFQTINQPQLSTPNLMNDPTMVDPSSLNKPPQFNQQAPGDNTFTLSVDSQSNNQSVPQHQQGQPQNDFKVKLMSAGLVNIDNLFNEAQPNTNTNLNYNFNTFDK